MYVQKSKLQHAADAAVLAGGYTYVADWDDPDKRTQVLNSMKKIPEQRYRQRTD